LPAKDWAELQALDRLDPFGPERGDWRMAILASLMVNLKRDPKKTKPFKPIDFMPFLDPELRKRSEQHDLKAALIGALKPISKTKRKKP
jgi:hypothetical protein